jgi:hypothetical protein
MLDNPLDPDCTDTTDERQSDIAIYQPTCSIGDPSMRCSDTSCRHWRYLGCLGQYCTPSSSCRSQHRARFDRFLLARTTNSHLSDECWSTMICFNKALPPLSLVSIYICYFLSYRLALLDTTNWRWFGLRKLAQQNWFVRFFELSIYMSESYTRHQSSIIALRTRYDTLGSSIKQFIHSRLVIYVLITWLSSFIIFVNSISS